MKNKTILTHSSIAAFKACRRRYQYRYVEGIELKDRPAYYDFGSAVHLALAKHYSGEKPEDVISAIVQYFADNAPAQDESERLATWEKSRQLLVEMFNGYRGHYPSEPFKPLVIEREFELPIVDVRGMAFDNMKLAGRVDMVVEESGLWIVEHKSAKTIDANYKRKLTLDAQSMLYLEAMERVYEKRFNGVIYNVLAKTAPVSPAVLKSGKLSQDKNQNTTPELYLWAIKELGLQEADYSEFVSWLSANRREYFYREYLTFSEDDRDEWRRELWQIAADIERALDTGAWYRNTANCVGFGACPYLDICTAPDKQFVIDASYEHKAIHSELAEDIA